jgi:carnitine O-acetyltransferase
MARWHRCADHFSDDLARKEQCSRAASLISGFAQIGQQVTNGTLEPEPNGKGPEKLCSNGYKFLFHSARVPGESKDAVNCYNPAMYNGEIFITRKNQLFSLNITGLNTDEIEAELQKIVAMAGETAAPNVGALTTASRDLWYSSRVKLLTDSTNAESLEMVERAMFGVCLDDISPITPTDVGRNALNGKCNRFFDKTLQLIVFANGKAVFIGEHSKSDGSPTARLCDDVLTTLATGGLDHSIPVVSGEKASKAITALPLSTTAVAAEIAEAEVYIEEEWTAHNWRAVRFTGYGNSAMKGYGMSPDAYTQMAMQLAYYRLNGKPCGTYESIMTRGFLHGRTEVGRSTSIDALNFCQAMDDPTVSDAAKVELLQTATTAHSGYLALAAKAQGVDRVLLGMKQMLTYATQPPPPPPAPASSTSYSSEALHSFIWCPAFVVHHFPCLVM